MKVNTKHIEKSTIVDNWLPRYTGLPIEKFGKHILLVNFRHYLESFASTYNVPIYGNDKAMQVATHEDISIINFGMGSPNAATIMDLLTSISPKAVIFLGKCGSLKKNIPVGALILPIGAIRGEGTSNDYFPPEVPALPSFQIERAVSHVIKKNERDYFSGTVYTTNRRVWEHDEEFKSYLTKIRTTAIDMETATILSVGFYNQIQTGVLLLVSDQPMTPDGVKTDKSDKVVTENYGKFHLQVGVEALKHIAESGESLKHLKF